MEEFDEQQAVAYMQQHATTTQPYTEDDLINLIDIIWDFYESQGLLKISFDDDDEDTPVDTAALVRYATKQLGRDKHNRIVPADVEPLVLAEMAYEATLEEDF